MAGRAHSTSDWRKGGRRLACVIALGTMLTGCDKCADWWWSPTRGDSQVCRDQAPKPN